ncbi:MAG: sulfurtransferase [Chloroflexi bacterium]|nr:MAG: sulfurtransferase [Chloroflexota bacterium]
MPGTETASSGMNAASDYAYPEVLVETDWVAEHLNDPHIRLIEVDADVSLYEVGHIPGAVKLDWHADIQDQLTHDVVDQASFERLMKQWSIANDTTIVFYGDQHNWYACYAFWLFTLYCHQKLKIMNGGRRKWKAEQRSMTSEVPHFAPTTYRAQQPDKRIRAYRDNVIYALKNPGRRLVDARSPQEYAGELLYMVEYPRERVQRVGHIPGAKNIPCVTATRADGTFKSAEELRQIYGGHDVTPDKEVIAYCWLGERSAHTWFVLTKLLGYPRVRNYDGSWAEWGNIVGAPIER